MGGLSSPGTDTSGKARDKKKMELLPGKKAKEQAWEGKRMSMGYFRYKGNVAQINANYSLIYLDWQLGGGL